jgi:superfamily I DNA/RNA helicase
LPNGRGLMVVGDDAQSIYSFRAATVRNILDFPKHFRPAADVVTLEQNYRSTCERFLTELTLDPPDATSGRAGADLKDEDYTVLSTIHSAKGQEWRIVRILNVVDGCIPSDRATGTSEEIEEERRLLYVAMTRAKDELDLIVPQRFFMHQQAKLPSSVIDMFMHRGAATRINQRISCQHGRGRRWRKRSRRRCP